MKNAILVHGCWSKEEWAEFLNGKYPSPSNLHWFPWVQAELVRAGIVTQTPEMPTPYAPEYGAWKDMLDQFVVDSETILVGHSCGAGFLLRWLGDTKKKINRLVLVAPWLDPIKKRKGFLDFKTDPSIQDRIREIHILVSSDDPEEGVKESVDIISSTFPKARVHQFENMGHFSIAEMKTGEFPELRDIILKGSYGNA